MSGIRRVGVLGAGLMGSGIAEACAKAGFDVVVREPTDELLAKGRKRITQSLSRAKERGKLREEELARYEAGRLVVGLRFEMERLKKSVQVLVFVSKRPAQNRKIEESPAVVITHAWVTPDE